MQKFLLVIFRLAKDLPLASAPQITFVTQLSFYIRHPFINPDLFPLNSIALNLVDYHIL